MLSSCSLSAVLVPTVACALFAGSDSILLGDGSRREVASLRLDTQRALCAAKDGSTQEFGLSELVRWNRDLPQEVAESGDRTGLVVVHLHDGSRVQGRVLRGGEDDLELDLGSGATVSLGVEAIHVVLFGDHAATLDPASFDQVEGSDALFRTATAGGDYTTGQFVSFSQTDITFEYSLGEAKFPQKDLVAVVLTPLVELPEPDPSGVELDLVPDGRLAGHFEGATPLSIRLRPLFAEEPVEIPLHRVRGVRFRGPGHEWLSDLAPAAVVETPYLGDSDLFLFPFRADRSVTGLPLRIAGHLYPKGLGCHSQSVLRYDLTGRGVTGFTCVVGLSDEVLALPEHGSVEFVVRADGEERYRSGPVRGGEEPRAVPRIDLRGVGTLELEVEFGEGQDVADRAVWGDALLLR